MSELNETLSKVIGDWGLSVERSGDLIVVKTLPGCAHVVASAIDRNHMSDVIGTIAGDDTVVVVAGMTRGSNVFVELFLMVG